MIISKPFKITKKRLIPFLEERELELAQYDTSYIHYYYLKVKGASVWMSVYAGKERFHTLKDVFKFIMANPSYNARFIYMNNTKINT